MNEYVIPSNSPGIQGDGYPCLEPLTPDEVARLEKILGKSLDEKARAWLLDTVRILIVGTAKVREG
jgi:hypothetical protein